MQDKQKMKGAENNIGFHRDIQSADGCIDCPSPTFFLIDQKLGEEERENAKVDHQIKECKETTRSSSFTF